MIVEVFLPDGPVVIGIDDTIERRWGLKIAARGIYRDRALPFLTVPSERWSTERGRQHKKLTDWARQAILQTRRWLPKRRIIVVADSSFAALDLIAPTGQARGLKAHVRRHVCLLTRLRLDASLFEPAPPIRPGRLGRPPKKGRRLPKLAQLLADPATSWTTLVLPEWYGGVRRMLETVSGTALWYHSGMPPAPIRWMLVRDPSGEREPQAFLSTELGVAPAEMLGWFVQRWSMETTFQETRNHLGVETQRQWSDLAIARTTPALLGLFSLVTISANSLNQTAMRPRTAAWYAKTEPTFSDAIAATRRRLWCPTDDLSISRPDRETLEIPTALWHRLSDALCYAA